MVLRGSPGTISSQTLRKFASFQKSVSNVPDPAFSACTIACPPDAFLFFVSSCACAPRAHAGAASRTKRGITSRANKVAERSSSSKVRLPKAKRVST